MKAKLRNAIINFKARSEVCLPLTAVLTYRKGIFFAQKWDKEKGEQFGILEVTLFYVCFTDENCCA